MANESNLPAGSVSGIDPTTGKEVILPAGIDFAYLASQTKFNAQEWEKAAIDLYGGYYEIIKDNEELKNLINEAIKNGYTSNEFQYRLEQTKWWKQTSASSRVWLEQSTRDPATAQSNVSNKMAEIKTQALNLGISLSDATLTRLATDSLKFGWNSTTLTNVIGAEATRESAGITELTKGYYGQSVQTTAAAYGVPISSQVLQDWTERIARGEDSLASFQSYARDLAKNLYPALSGGLDRGLTFKQMTDPYAQMASNILEIPSSQVDFTDPKWAAAFTMKDSKGQQMQMSYGEWADYLRTTPSFGYEYTDQAKNKAYDVVDRLAKMFGAG